METQTSSVKDGRCQTLTVWLAAAGGWPPVPAAQVGHPSGAAGRRPPPWPCAFVPP